MCKKIADPTGGIFKKSFNIRKWNSIHALITILQPTNLVEYIYRQH